MNKLISAVFAAGAVVLGSPAAHAAGYPEKPVTMIVPSAPGGTLDALGRLMAQGMAVLVVLQPGGMGQAGRCRQTRRLLSPRLGGTGHGENRCTGGAPNGNRRRGCTCDEAVIRRHSGSAHGSVGVNVYFSVPLRHFVPIGVRTQPTPLPVMLPPFSSADTV